MPNRNPGFNSLMQLFTHLPWICHWFQWLMLRDQWCLWYTHHREIQALINDRQPAWKCWPNWGQIRKQPLVYWQTYSILIDDPGQSQKQDPPLRWSTQQIWRQRLAPLLRERESLSAIRAKHFSRTSPAPSGKASVLLMEVFPSHSCTSSSLSSSYRGGESGVWSPGRRTFNRHSTVIFKSIRYYYIP